ncbi:MAG: hypothetical protein VYA30_07735 [Myxococcota bacterium]|nr:hypothetical protein [Myxococcota bacterium]
MLLIFLGCASEWQLDDASTDLLSDPTHPHWTHDLDDGTQKSHGQVDCSTRWPADDQQARAQQVSFSWVGARCLDGPQSGARALGDYIRTRFGQHMNQRIVGRGIQIFNCRKVQGSRTLSVHAEGRAIDVFIPTRNGKADNSKGDRIANWLLENATQIGIQQIIWDRTIWNSRDNQANCYRKKHPHHDHIHLELNWAGARKQTPFFYEGNDNQSRAPAPDSSGQSHHPTPPSETADGPPDPDRSDLNDSSKSESHVPETDESAGGPEPQRQPSTRSAAWLGTPCLMDSNCEFTVSGLAPSCVKPDGSQLGVCTLSCDGFCPDRNGFAMTFCTDATALGLPGVGLCLAQADTENRHCDDWVGFSAENQPRFIDQSQANHRNTGVCVPTDRTRTDAAESRTRPGMNSNDGVCADPTLPVTRHGESCQGVVENTWRCGCSRRFETVVSQFCRDEIWQTYNLDPRDCSRCSGDYSSGCEP